MQKKLWKKLLILHLLNNVKIVLIVSILILKDIQMLNSYHKILKQGAWKDVITIPLKSLNLTLAIDKIISRVIVFGNTASTLRYFSLEPCLPIAK